MTDNGSPADATSADQPAEQFPLRLRVHALARTLGLTSREVLGHLEELGVAARTAQSSISREQAHAVAERLAGGEAEQPTDTVPAAAEAAASAETPAEPVVEAPVAEEAAAEKPAPERPAADKPAADKPAVQGTTESLFSALSVEEPAAVAAPVDSTAPLFLPPTTPVEPAPKARPERAAAEKSTAEKSAGDQPAESTPAGDQPAAAAAESGDEQAAADQDATDQDSSDEESGSADDQDGNGEGGRPRRRRRGRRGRGRGRGDAGEQNENDTDDAAEPADGATAEGDSAADSVETEAAESAPSKDGTDESAAETAEGETATTETAEADADAEDGDESGEETTPSSKRRRRRRRRRSGTDGTDESSPDDPPNTVVHEREPRAKRVRDEVQGISGSTRLEAKRQRRRDGRDAGRRRPPILSESEFLARREAVERVMVVRERIVDPAVAAADPHAPTEDYTQVAVLEDGVLVEHFVTTETSQSMVGNIYLGRVQNVLPGMEAAFVDIGRGRNGVLYAGEVNWEAAGLDGGSRKIEQALKPGDSVLVQVSKDPVGHKGARLTTQISLAGRYLVYVPGGTSTGISRKLPDTERKRLKQILAKIVPDEAGVIIRTASEGVSAEELGADVERLEAQWKSIEAESAKHIEKASGTTRALYEEPDLLVRVVRDLFNEDFSKLVVEGDKSWDLVSGYVGRVAPDLMERVERFEPASPTAADSFGVYRVDEQLAKALDRKVWLPSGGTLIIEHTEAMTVVDVNTGKFTGSGGNLEATVTRNNLEAAEEIVRQMRLRDIGGMIIVDFIDMVLESNRDLVLRRLTEALSRDRTRHQVSEVTSLGLVQMTRKRLGTGLLEAFSTTCSHCQGRGVIVHANPVEVRGGDDGSRGGDGGGSKRSRRNKQQQQQRKADQPAAPEAKPHKPAAEHPLFKAMAHHEDEEAIGDDATRTEEGAQPETAAAQVSAEATAGDSGSGDATGADRPARSRSRRRGRGQGSPNGQNGQDGSPDTGSADAASAAVTEASSRETVAPAPAPAPETSQPEAPAAHAPQTPQAPAAPAAATTTRRRRAVRRAAAPTAPPEPIVVATEQAPVTTVAEQAADPVVAVKRTPRRRSGQRAAGPPQE